MSTTMGRLSALLFLGASLATPVAAKDLAASLRGKWLVDKKKPDRGAGGSDLWRGAGCRAGAR